LIYSFPTVCKSGEWQIVQGRTISDFSREKMKATETELREEFRLAIFEVVFSDVSGRELLVQQPELLEEFVLARRTVVCIVVGVVGTLAVTDRKLFSFALLLTEFALTLLIRLGTSGQAESPPSDDLDVDGLGALATSGDLEFDGVPVVQRAATGADDVGVMDEDVVAVVTRDEAEALLVVEKLHCACSHFGSLFNTGATIDSRLQLLTIVTLEPSSTARGL